MARSAVFRVSLSRPSALAVQVNYATMPGTAQPVDDFTSVSGTISFSPGQTSAVVVVPIVEPLDGEPQKQFTLVLSSPVNATLADGTGVGVIPQKSPTEFPVVSVADASHATSITFVVSLSQAHTVASSISYSTKSITAIAGEDYTPVSGTLNFAIGETSKNVVVTLLAKSDRELKLKLSLDNPSKLTLFRISNGVGTITPDATVVANVADAKNAKTAYDTAITNAAASKDTLDKKTIERDDAVNAYNTAVGEQTVAIADVAAATNNVSNCQQQLTNVTALSLINNAYLPLVAVAQQNLNDANVALTAAQGRKTTADANVSTTLSAKNAAVTAYNTADSDNTTKQALVVSTKATFDSAYLTAKNSFVGSTEIDF